MSARCLLLRMHLPLTRLKDFTKVLKCDGNVCFGRGVSVCVTRVTLACISADKQRVTDALEAGPRTKGCSGVVRDGSVPVWHRRTSNYPGWRPLPSAGRHLHPKPQRQQTTAPFRWGRTAISAQEKSGRNNRIKGNKTLFLSSRGFINFISL